MPNSNNATPENINIQTNSAPLPRQNFQIDSGQNSRASAKPTFFDHLKFYFSQYCVSTGVHGVKYLAERGRNIVERLFWIVVILIMMCICFGFISKVITKRNTSLGTISISSTETPIWHVPFPAVTICPAVKSNLDFYRFGDLLKKKVKNRFLTLEETVAYESLAMICPAAKSIPEPNTIVFSRDGDPIPYEEKVIANIDKAFTDFSRDEWVVWMGKEHEHSLISKLYTSHGLCYSFNSLLTKGSINPNRDDEDRHHNTQCKIDEWSLEKAYGTDNQTDCIPRRATKSGPNGGLQIDLFANKSHIDWLCSDAEGFWVTLHDPGELPNMDSGFLIPLDHSVSLAVRPKLIVTEENLRSYPVEQRKCFFSHEKQLRYFKTYTQKNCFEECLTNSTLNQCSCLLFYMPKLNEELMCNVLKRNCTDRIKSRFFFNTTLDNEPPCNCLPSCTSIEYEVDISDNNWKWTGILSAQNNLTEDKYCDLLENSDAFHLSRLNVYFKEMHFLALIRQDIYDYTEFLANIGGLLFLFLGFSVLSAFEILYFLTIRIVCNVEKYGRKYWSGYIRPKQEQP